MYKTNTNPYMHQIHQNLAKQEAQANGSEFKPEFYAGQTVYDRWVMKSAEWFMVETSRNGNARMVTYFNPKECLMVTFKDGGKCTAIVQDARSNLNLGRYVQRTNEIKREWRGF